MRVFIALVAAVTSAVSAWAARDSVPAWLTQAATAPVQVSVDGASAVVLLDEAVVEIGKDAVRTTRQRYAVRILSAEGRREARAVVPYSASSGKVQSLRGWLRRSSGSVVEYGKKQIVDVALNANALELYSDMRSQVLRAPESAVAVGDVFGFEAVYQERTIFTQCLWAFQGGLPVERSSFTLKLPPGWNVEARAFNHEAREPLIEGASRTWTLAQLPAPETEAYSPPPSAYIPMLALDLRPPAGDGAKLRLLEPRSWPELSGYFTPHYESASAADAALRNRAEELVAGRGSKWEQIQALARFAQQVNYISITLDAQRAGGMIPRPARDVHRLNYGDCKDKATLLRSLLASQGIRSHPAIVFAGEESHVREEWPSPFQFNHCILAIEVDETVGGTAVVEHPELGRLLYFDPTDEYTPPGRLDSGRLARHALLIAGERGGLVALPEEDAASDRLERRVKATLTAAGDIEGTIEEDFLGLNSNAVRSERRQRSASDYQKVIERWLARTLPAPRASRVDVDEDALAPRFSLGIDFSAIGYAKPMRDVLLVFKPVLVARRDHPVLRARERRQPLQIGPRSFRETSTISLPEGFKVDELPPAVDLRTSFGTYRARTSVEQHTLHVERSLEVNRCTLPPDQAGVVREFFEAILRAEQTPVVLERI